MCYTSKWMIIRAGAGFHRFRALPPVSEWLQVKPVLFLVPRMTSDPLLQLCCLKYENISIATFEIQN